MHELLALAGLVAALAIGVVSPGPSFVMVARVSVATSRVHGLAAALGMGLGGMVFAAAALMGLHGLFHAVPALYLVLKVAGGLYLCWLGWMIFKSAREPLAAAEGMAQGGSAARMLLLGFATQVSNPKTAIVYASVFAAFLPPQFSLGFAAALLLVVFAIEAGWYALVALLLSSARPQSAYLAGKRWVDRAAGAVMFGLGAKLVADAARD